MGSYNPSIDLQILYNLYFHSNWIGELPNFKLNYLKNQESYWHIIFAKLHLLVSTFIWKSFRILLYFIFPGLQQEREVAMQCISLFIE